MADDWERNDSTNLLPFRVNRVTKDLAEKARNELNEETDSQSKIEELRTLIKAKKNFDVPTDDAFLLQFLRARKFNVQSAFVSVNSCYHQMNGNRDIFDNCDSADIREVIESGHVYCLPKRAPDGAVVMVVRCELWDPEKFHIHAMINAWLRVMWHCIDDPATQVTGVRTFVDAKGLSIKHVRCLKPRYMYMFSQNIRNSIPVRFKGFHMFNESRIFHFLWSAISIFLTEKLRKRVHFHGSTLDSLHKELPPSILPVEYRGEVTRRMPDQEYVDSNESFHDRYVEIVRAKEN